MAEENARLESLWSRVDGLPVHARISMPRSSRPPVVLVHGLGVSGRYLLPTGRLLAGRFAVYVPDLPGFGRSARPPRVLSIAELANALAGWMRTFGLERAVLLGNSMGCQVLVELALRQPALVDRLVLVGPTVDGFARTFARQAFRLLRDSAREPAALLPIIASDYLSAGPRRTLATGIHALRHVYEGRLGEIAAPALVVRGELDALVSQAWAEEVVRRLPAGRLVTVPGSAHAVNFAAPEALAAAVQSFAAG